MSNVHDTSTLQLQAAIFHDSVFVTGANPNANGNHVLERKFYSLNRFNIDIGTHFSMTVARIDQDITWV